MLAAAAAWGIVQIATHQTVYELRTWEAVLIWTTNLVVFLLALEAGSLPQHRERLLRAILVFTFALSVVSTFTLLTSPIGKAFWWFDAGRTARTRAFRVSEPVCGICRSGTAAGDRTSDSRPSQIVAVYPDDGDAVRLGGCGRIPHRDVPLPGRDPSDADVRVAPRTSFHNEHSREWCWEASPAVAVLTAVVGWNVIWTRLQEPNPYSVLARAAQSSLEMVRDRPVLGFGLGDRSAAYPRYAHFDDGAFVNQAHNDWVQWAAEGGRSPFFLIMLASPCGREPGIPVFWGVGLLAVFLHCLVDYPMQQRPALAAFFFAMLGDAGGGDRKVANPPV